MSIYNNINLLRTLRGFRHGVDIPVDELHGSVPAYQTYYNDFNRLQNKFLAGVKSSSLSSSLKSKVTSCLSSVTSSLRESRTVLHAAKTIQFKNQLITLINLLEDVHKADSSLEVYTSPMMSWATDIAGRIADILGKHKKTSHFQNQNTQESSGDGNEPGAKIAGASPLAGSGGGGGSGTVDDAMRSLIGDANDNQTVANKIKHSIYGAGAEKDVQDQLKDILNEVVWTVKNLNDLIPDIDALKENLRASGLEEEKIETIVEAYNKANNFKGGDLNEQATNLADSVAKQGGMFSNQVIDLFAIQEQLKKTLDALPEDFAAQMSMADVGMKYLSMLQDNRSDHHAAFQGLKRVLSSEEFSNRLSESNKILLDSVKDKEYEELTAEELHNIHLLLGNMAADMEPLPISLKRIHGLMDDTLTSSQKIAHQMETDPTMGRRLAKAAEGTSQSLSKDGAGLASQAILATTLGPVGLMIDNLFGISDKVSEATGKLTGKLTAKAGKVAGRGVDTVADYFRWGSLKVKTAVKRPFGGDGQDAGVPGDANPSPNVDSESGNPLNPDLRENPLAGDVQQQRQRDANGRFIRGDAHVQEPNRPRENYEQLGSSLNEAKRSDLALNSILSNIRGVPIPPVKLPDNKKDLTMGNMIRRPLISMLAVTDKHNKNIVKSMEKGHKAADRRTRHINRELKSANKSLNRIEKILLMQMLKGMIPGLSMGGGKKGPRVPKPTGAAAGAAGKIAAGAAATTGVAAAAGALAGKTSAAPTPASTPQAAGKASMLSRLGTRGKIAAAALTAVGAGAGYLGYQQLKADTDGLPPVPGEVPQPPEPISSSAAQTQRNLDLDHYEKLNQVIREAERQGFSVQDEKIHEALRSLSFEHEAVKFLQVLGDTYKIDSLVPDDQLELLYRERINHEMAKQAASSGGVGAGAGFSGGFPGSNAGFSSGGGGGGGGAPASAGQSQRQRQAQKSQTPQFKGPFSQEAMDSNLFSFSPPPARPNSSSGVHSNPIITDTSQRWEGLGSLASGFETSGKSIAEKSGVVGDLKGGNPSFGAFQIETSGGRGGTMVPFLRYLDKHDPDKATQLRAAVQADGGRYGQQTFRDVWKNMADTDPNFFSLQHGFIRETHYEPAARKAERHGLNMEDRRIQEAIWSASVQHSGAGISEILKTASSSPGFAGASSEDQLRALYKARGDYAYNSLIKKHDENYSNNASYRRYNQELAVALKMPSTYAPEPEPENGGFRLDVSHVPKSLLVDAPGTTVTDQLAEARVVAAERALMPDNLPEEAAIFAGGSDFPKGVDISQNTMAPIAGREAVDPSTGLPIGPSPVTESDTAGFSPELLAAGAVGAGVGGVALAASMAAKSTAPMAASVPANADIFGGTAPKLAPLPAPATMPTPTVAPSTPISGVSNRLKSIPMVNSAVNQSIAATTPTATPVSLTPQPAPTPAINPGAVAGEAAKKPGLLSRAGSALSRAKIPLIGGAVVGGMALAEGHDIGDAALITGGAVGGGILASMAVGAAAGTLIPIPIAGTLAGAAVGLAAGIGGSILGEKLARDYIENRDRVDELETQHKIAETTQEAAADSVQEAVASDTEAAEVGAKAVSETSSVMQQIAEVGAEDAEEAQQTTQALENFSSSIAQSGNSVQEKAARARERAGGQFSGAPVANVHSGDGAQKANEILAQISAKQNLSGDAASNNLIAGIPQEQSAEIQAFMDGIAGPKSLTGDVRSQFENQHSHKDQAFRDTLSPEHQAMVDSFMGNIPGVPPQSIQGEARTQYEYQQSQRIPGYLDTLSQEDRDSFMGNIPGVPPQSISATGDPVVDQIVGNLTGTTHAAPITSSGVIDQMTDMLPWEIQQPVRDAQSLIPEWQNAQNSAARGTELGQNMAHVMTGSMTPQEAYTQPMADSFEPPPSMTSGGNTLLDQAVRQNHLSPPPVSQAYDGSQRVTPPVASRPAQAGDNKNIQGVSPFQMDDLGIIMLNAGIF